MKFLNTSVLLILTMVMISSREFSSAKTLTTCLKDKNRMSSYIEEVGK